MPGKHDALVPEWVRLYTQEGLTQLQIAERYGLTRNQVKNAMSRYQGAPSDEEVPSVVDGPDWVDRLYENAKEQARLRQEVAPLETVLHREIETDLPVMLVHTADWHLLDGGTDHDLFDELMDIWLHTPGIHLGGGGDYADWFSSAVLPRAVASQTLPNEYTEPIIRRKFELTRHLWEYVIDGNHDLFPGATGWFPVKAICRELGLPHLGSGGRVYLKVGDVTYQIDARHEHLFKSSLNDTNDLRRTWEKSGKGDMVFGSHTHRPTLHIPDFDGFDVVFARNGALKRYDGFARAKNFVHVTPSPSDQPGVILFPDKRKKIAFRDFRDGLHTLKALRGGR